MFTRRSFLKKGVVTAGLSAIGGISAVADDCPFKSLSTPGPIPLNNILVDNQQEQSRGYGLQKVTICDKDSWEAKRLNIMKRAALIIGHSLGGYNSFFLNAFEPRIKAAVISCGLSPMGDSNTPYQFARNTWFVHLNPICREYIRAGMIPCDFHEIMALGAPTPMFNYSGKKDATYSPRIANKEDDFSAWWKTVDEALSQIAGVYKILAVPENFVRVETDEGHGFPEEIMQKAYKFLDKNLQRV